jgi:hypothetical protein
MNEPRNFNDLVTHCTWQVIEGLIEGEPLRSMMFRLLDYARRWEPTP